MTRHRRQASARPIFRHSSGRWSERASVNIFAASASRRARDCCFRRIFHWPRSPLQWASTIRATIARCSAASSACHPDSTEAGNSKALNRKSKEMLHVRFWLLKEILIASGFFSFGNNQLHIFERDAVGNRMIGGKYITAVLL